MTDPGHADWMTRFSPADAALEGFRLTWERPGAVLLWALVRFVFTVIGLCLFIAQGGPEAVRLLSAASGPTTESPEVLATLLAHVAPGMAGLFLVNLLGYSLVYTAVLRSVLRPTDRRFGALRLGRDEGLQLLLVLATSATIFVYSVGVGLLSNLAMALPEPIGGLLRMMVFVASTAAVIALLVRLSLAPAQTLEEGRFRFLSAVARTQGHFWPILTTFLMAAILSAVVVLLAAVIFFLVVGAVGLSFGGPGGLAVAIRGLEYSPGAVRELLDPRVLLNLSFSSLLATLAYVLMMAPAAAVYRSLRGERETPRTPLAQSGRPWG